MILVNPFKAKGITAMFRSLARGKPESATTVGNFNISRAACSLPEVYIESEGIRIGAVCVAEEARVPAWAGTGGAHGRKLSSTQMSFNLESQQHEQTSRGFAGL